MDKTQILSHVSASQIYAKFLQIEAIPEKNIKSPFATDTNPSFRVYKNGTFKCFSSGKQGDVFQFVADLNKLDCKADFQKVTDLIANEFGLDENKPALQYVEVRKPEPKEENHFKIEHQKFTDLHYGFWHLLSVEPAFIEKYKVKAVKKFEYFHKATNAIKKFPIFDNVLAFSYEVNGRYEIYIPAQPEKKVNKFFHSALSNDDIFGFTQLEDFQDNLLIVAGKKDCLVANARGFKAVAFRSEAIFPNQKQIQILKAKCKNLFICYDNDFEKPNNPGRTQMEKIAKEYDLIPIYLPEKINDVTDYFKSFHTEDFQKLANISYSNFKATKEQKTAVEPKVTIFHITEKYLSAFYDFRYNTIKLDIEMSAKNQNIWKSVNENSIYIEMQKKGINVSIDKLLSILKSDFVKHFNPLIQYFNDLPKWKQGDKDFIDELANFVNATHQQQFNHHFKKWLVRSVKCATINDYFNKQAFVLVHSSQNSGKSTFCRFLCPPALSDYLAEDISNDKDARVLLCKNFLINLDELAVLSRQEINSLKSYFSKTQINERLPYDRKNSIIHRTCSFIGSTNMDEFLNDETGSVRWLCFKINAISWEYKKQVNINRVWAQALTLANDPDFDCEMNLEDIQANEERNKDFTILSPERALINKLLAKPTATNTGEFLTSTEIEMYLKAWSNLTRLTSVGVGKAMKAQGFERTKYDGVYGYFAIKRQDVNLPTTHFQSSNISNN